MGSSAYAVSAIIATRAARSPSHGSGSRNPNIANEGIVCSTFATPITGFAHRGRRVSHTPTGTAIAVANSIAAPVSHKCSTVSSAISPPYCPRNPLIRVSPQLALLRDETPAHIPRPPAAATAKTPRASGSRPACPRSAARSDPPHTVPHPDRASPATPSPSPAPSERASCPASPLVSADREPRTAHPSAAHRALPPAPAPAPRVVVARPTADADIAPQTPSAPVPPPRAAHDSAAPALRVVDPPFPAPAPHRAPPSCAETVPSPGSHT